MEYRYLIWSCVLLSVYAEFSCKIYGSVKNAVICKSGNSDYTLERGLVSDRNETTKIVLRDCMITKVDREAFANLPRLRHLDLSRNKIQSLAPGVFSGISKMNHLNLSSNSITKLPSNLFESIPNVLNVDLSGNPLATIELGLFDPLAKLKVLNLSSSSIKGAELSSSLFDKNPDISILDLSRNDMSFAPDNILHTLQSLEYLDLERAFLKEVPTFTTGPNLATLKRLVLSTNQIGKIDNAATFVNLDNLEILHLDGNNIESINEDVFQPLRKVRGIYLRSNKLSAIPTKLFQNIPKLVNLDLSHNYIASITADAFKGTSLKNLNLSDNEITFMPEKFCLQLRDNGIVLSKFYFMPNPWQCSCLNELMREVKSLDIQYNANYFDGVRSVCTVSGAFSCQRS